VAVQTTTAPRSYHFGPLERRSLLAGLRAPQVGLVGGGGLLAMLMVRLAPSATGLGLAAVSLAAASCLAFVKVGGRNLDEWMAPVGRWVGSMGHSRRWASTTPLFGDVAGRGGKTIEPPTLAGVRILNVSVADGDVGVVKDARNGTYTGVVAARGRAFALLERSAQERRLGSWAEVMSGWAREGTPLFRLQWVERTVSEDGEAMGAYLGENVALPTSSPVVRSYLELLERAAPLSERHEVYVALSVSSRKAFRQIRRAGGGDKGACEVLVRELNTLMSRLRTAEVNVDGVLGPRELARTMRTAFDPAAAEGLVLRGRADGSLAGASPKNAFPVGTEAHWDCYRTDGAWHATFWIAEWPRLDVGADFLAPLLLQTTATRTISVVMEPVPPAKATKAVEMARTSFMADEEIRTKAGFLSSIRRQREHEAIVRREQELADGHGEFRFSGFVTVTAPDRESLEYAATEVVQSAHQCRLDLRRLYGEQDVAFTATMPLGRGLR
jgi:hypothetical protein